MAVPTSSISSSGYILPAALFVLVIGASVRCAPARRISFTALPNAAPTMRCAPAVFAIRGSRQAQKVTSSSTALNPPAAVNDGPSLQALAREPSASSHSTKLTADLLRGGDFLHGHHHSSAVACIAASAGQRGKAVPSRSKLCRSFMFLSMLLNQPCDASAEDEARRPNSRKQSVSAVMPKIVPQSEEIWRRLETVPSLDVVAYSGRWYQMYGSVGSMFEGGPIGTFFCQSFDYTAQPGDDRIVNILNQAVTEGGEIVKISGTAQRRDASGRFTVQFERSERGQESISESEYMVSTVGPKVDGKYAYSVVAVPDKTQIFVLARNPNTFGDLYAKEVKGWLGSNGFNITKRKRESFSAPPVNSMDWFDYNAKLVQQMQKLYAGDDVASSSRGIYGKYGQNACISIKGLSPPADGTIDPRI